MGMDCFLLACLCEGGLGGYSFVWIGEKVFYRNYVSIRISKIIFKNLLWYCRISTIFVFG